MPPELDDVRGCAWNMTDVHKFPRDLEVPSALELPQGPKFRIVLAGDVDLTEGFDWCVPNLLPRRGLMAIYGPPGAGKSFLAIDVAARIAAGMALLGTEVLRGGAIYIAAESPAGLHRRAAAWLRYHGRGPELPFGVVPVAPSLGTLRSGNETDRLVADIKAGWRLDSPIRVIVIDTLARTMMGADENSAADMGAFVRNAETISRAFDSLVIVVHHSGKQHERGMRGSSALHAACDTEWEIRTKAGSERTVSVVKQKDGQDGLTFRFRLLSQPLTSSLPGTGIHSSSCVVEYQSHPVQEGSETRLSRADRTVYEACLACTKAATTTGDIRTVEARVVRSDLRARVLAGTFGNPNNPKARDTQFNRSIRSLEEKQLIGVDNQYVWPLDAGNMQPSETSEMFPGSPAGNT